MSYSFFSCGRPKTLKTVKTDTQSIWKTGKLEAILVGWNGSSEPTIFVFFHILTSTSQTMGAAAHVSTWAPRRITQNLVVSKF